MSISVESVGTGIEFPSNPENGERYLRSDLGFEVFTYIDSLSKWVGELMQDGYGDSGSLSNNQYFRRYNGMGTGPDRGIGFTHEVLLVEHGVNWESPNNSTGNIEIELNGSIIHSLPTVGDGPSSENVAITIPANSIIAFRRDGNTISNTQGFIKYKRIL